MIKVEIWAEIRRLFYVGKKAKKDIARILGIHVQTVRKLLKKEKCAGYKREKMEEGILFPFYPHIQKWVEEEKKITAKRIHNLLCEDYGYNGSYPTVANYVRSLKEEKKGTLPFLNLEPPIGKEAQSDWTNVEVILAGKRIKLNLFACKLSYSGKTFTRCFYQQRQECLFQGQKEAFEYFEGVPHSVIYDNLKPAVKEILKGRERIEQESFASFHGHYCFKPEFARPGTPTDKGDIENEIKYIKNNFFRPIPSFQSLEELNFNLLKDCEQDARKRKREQEIIELRYQREKSRLIQLPLFPFECCKTIFTKIDKFAQVWFESNRYSVPAEYAFRKVVLKAYEREILVLSLDKCIARHKRCLSTHRRIIEPAHYLNLLSLKPHAVDSALALRRWKIPSVFYCYKKELEKRKNISEAQKQYALILCLTKQYPLDEVALAVKESMEAHIYGLEYVEQILLQKINRKEEENPQADLSRYPRLQNITVENADLKIYAPLCSL